MCPHPGSKRGYAHSEMTKAKMRTAARRVGADPEERKRRSERAKRQWAEGRIGKPNQRKGDQA